MSSGKLGGNVFVDMLTTPRLDKNPIIEIEQPEVISSPNLEILNQSYQKAVEIHTYLCEKNKFLTNNEKLKFCSAGRYFMKQYLKEIVKKVSSSS